MNQPKLSPRHLERIAFVYLRQSSPGQVKKNVEGGERQRQMQHQVQEWGWPKHQVRVLGGDTGCSGSSVHGRDDYQVMLESVMAQEAGLICGRDLSRLARDNQDWNQLVRLCRYQGVLLADEHRLYDPTDPQDRVVLGIQGAFNEFELAMICDRMQKSRIQKARRGELYEGFPPGYICRHAPLYEKHPDPRVQRAIEKVFQEYEHAPSACQMLRRLLEQGYQLPVVPSGSEWRDVQWTAPRYQQLVDMLRNPTYAGIYARGRRKTYTILNEEGHAEKKRQRVARDHWDVFLEGHHEPYISQETWERNLEKLASSAASRKQMTNPRSPQSGSGLMVGLLRCRRCGHKLHATYRSGKVSYLCRKGAAQRDAGGKACFSFRGARVEARLVDLILEVVSPAGVELAQQAAAILVAGRQQQRQLMVDRLEACREAEARAAREYKMTDATYTTVRRRLAQEWDDSLQALQIQQTRLATFEKQNGLAPSDEQQAELQRLSADLGRIWNHPQVDAVLKKQILRTLINELVVDVEQPANDVVVTIHWVGGHHTELREPRHWRRQRAKGVDLVRVVGTLRKVLEDTAIANVLNREKLPAANGDTWTARRVAAFRKKHELPAFNMEAKEQYGWLTQAEAATRLQISSMSMTRLVQEGIVPAEQPLRGLPSVINQADLQLTQIQGAVDQLKASSNRPLSRHRDQLSLFPSTDLQRSVS